MPHVPAPERREQLIAAALEVIAKEGIAGATTRRIAHAAQASPAALHYAFDSKEDLYLAVFEHLMNRFYEVHEEIEGDLPERAARLVELCAEWALASPWTERAEMELALWASRQRVENETLAQRFYAIAVDRFVRLLGGDDAADRQDPTLTAVARQVIHVVDGSTLHWFANGDDQVYRADARAGGEMLRSYATLLTRPVAAATG